MSVLRSSSAMIARVRASGLDDNGLDGRELEDKYNDNSLLHLFLFCMP